MRIHLPQNGGYGGTARACEVGMLTAEHPEFVVGARKPEPRRSGDQAMEQKEIPYPHPQ